MPTPSRGHGTQRRPRFLGGFQESLTTLALGQGEFEDPWGLDRRLVFFVGPVTGAFGA